MAQEPAWISEAPPSQPAPATYGTDATGNDSRLMYAWGAVKTIIVGCTAMMAANGVLAFINLDRSSNPVSDMFVALYVILFAMLLALHEVNEVRPLSTVEGILLRNFGFLFKPFGKGCFIIFIAFLNFGLTVNSQLGLATGICLSIVGAGYIFVYLRSPQVFERGNPLAAKPQQQAYVAPPHPGPGV